MATANTSALQYMENFFMAFSDATRLRIVNLMREGEVCVTYFSEVLGCSQPKVSRHLAYLRKSGLVRTRRDGKWIYYSIASPEVSASQTILEELLRWLNAQEPLRAEFERYRAIRDAASVAEYSDEGRNIYASTNSTSIQQRPAHNEIDEFLL